MTQQTKPLSTHWWRGYLLGLKIDMGEEGEEPKPGELASQEWIAGLLQGMLDSFAANT